MNKTIDFTKMRKGSKPLGRRVVDYCPTCGRKGEKVTYTNGERMFAHKGHFAALGFFNITDSCFIPANAQDGR